jgi:hypothetical protein
LRKANIDDWLAEEPRATGGILTSWLALPKLMKLRVSISHGGPFLDGAYEAGPYVSNPHIPEPGTNQFQCLST